MRMRYIWNSGKSENADNIAAVTENYLRNYLMILCHYEVMYLRLVRNWA
jgi:hypothetical protein